MRCCCERVGQLSGTGIGSGAGPAGSVGHSQNRGRSPLPAHLISIIAKLLQSVKFRQAELQECSNEEHSGFYVLPSLSFININIIHAVL